LKLRKVNEAKTEFIDKHSNKDDLEQTKKLDEISQFEKEALAPIYEVEESNVKEEESENISSKDNKLKLHTKFSSIPSLQVRNNQNNEKVDTSMELYSNNVVSTINNSCKQIKNKYESPSYGNKKISPSSGLSNLIKNPINFEVNDIILKSLNLKQNNKYIIQAGNLPEINPYMKRFPS